MINIVVAGHVDHGKSTLLGRLLADVGSLPDGKLEDIKEKCRATSKEFEYAFLLDALKDERSQGITIDSARVFLRGKKRDYLFIDSPGHYNFLKNMVSGASRAEAAVLVIDASEGVRDNSKRHGYLISMLGIRQIAVVVNKMDAVNYDQNAFEKIKREYEEFLSRINIDPVAVIPASARNGGNVASSSGEMSWYDGPTVFDVVESFNSAPRPEDRPFRMPVQDVYRFTADASDKRFFAGRVDSGKISVGDRILFYPSKKRSSVKTIEMFNSPEKRAIGAGYSTSFTLDREVYVRHGEIMCRESEKEHPKVSTLFRAEIFWMGDEPLNPAREYKLKLGASKVYARVASINRVLDIESLKPIEEKNQVDRNEIAECVIETVQPMAFDVASEFAETGRFVLVDGYEIAGGGIIVEAMERETANLRERISEREVKWVKGDVLPGERLGKYGRKPGLILVTGRSGIDKVSIAKKVEKKLSEASFPAYYIGIRSIIYGIDSDLKSTDRYRDEHVRRLAEVIHILLDAGLTVVSTASGLDDGDIEAFETILKGQDMKVIVVGENEFIEKKAALEIDPADSPETAAKKISNLFIQ